MSTPLLRPVTIGRWSLPNRVIMAPLTRCRSGDDRTPNALMAEYYRQRASAGLIISEACSVCPMGVGYARTPGIWSEAQIEGWKLTTTAVHNAGGRIILQLWHVGRVSHPVFLDGALPVAPSAIAPEGYVNLLRPRTPFVTPRALETDELPAIVEAYRVASENALTAGFDGVELHGANGYLLDQFLQDRSNQRTDHYGGSIENRARLMCEVVDAAISVWGADRVGLHLAPRGDFGTMGDSDPRATFGYVAQQMKARGLAFLFTREGRAEPRLTPFIKQQFGGPVIENQALSVEDGETLLASGSADAIAWGQLYISNPDLVERIAAGHPLTPPDVNTYYSDGPTGYTDYKVAP